MNHPFLGKKILVVVAHPDDESFAMGGTLYENARRGGETILVCATLGEEGTAHLLHPMKKRELKRTRKEELDRAARTLGISKLFLLNLPDAKLHLPKFSALFFKKACMIADACSPDAILSFGAYGSSGHRDHIVAGKVAKRIAKRINAPLFTITNPPAFAKDFLERVKTSQQGPYYTRKKPFFEPPAVRIAVDQNVKVRAIMCHASQLGGKPPFAALPPRIRKKRMRMEYFAKIS